MDGLNDYASDMLRKNSHPLGILIVEVKIVLPNVNLPSFSRRFPQQLVVNFGNDAAVFIDVFSEAKFFCHRFSIIGKKKSATYMGKTKCIKRSI